MPPVLQSEAEFLAALESIKAGDGPIAIDAERASGYRYSQRAYLIQIFRRGGGLYLIDPIAIPNRELWTELGETFADTEWIIHASTQDLPCLRELGLEPRILFDTELGGRIAGASRVGLGALCESLLGFRLAKEHSAVDWSTRPLKEEWLNYAALDVDLLVDLRDEVAKLLESTGKLEWAKEEFASILKLDAAPARKDPWRKTSGMHKVRDRMTLAIVRAMWTLRDEYAREIDISPGRIFNDQIIMEICARRPKSAQEFAKLVTRRTKLVNLPTDHWFEIFNQTLLLTESQLPEVRTPSTGLPPIKVWKDRNAPAYARITHARSAIAARAQELSMPTENLLSPDLLRQLMWETPPAQVLLSSRDSELYVKNTLAELGARPWQIDQCVASLLEPLLATEPLVVEVASDEETSAEVAASDQ